jgi:hypothetical protein
METDQSTRGKTTWYGMMYWYRKSTGAEENIKEIRDPEIRGSDSSERRHS